MNGGLIGNGEIFGGRMETGLMGSGLVRNKPSANVFTPIEYINIYPDPHLANVVLYLKGDGENNSTNIVDSSPNPKTITRFGNIKILTAQSKYGGSSLFFNGSDQYLTIPASSDFALDNNDFTVECWCRASASSDYSYIFDRYSGGSFHYGIGLMSRGIHFYVRNSAGSAALLNYVSVQLINLNQWHHIVWQRRNNVLEFFIDGVKTSTTASLTASLTNTPIVTIGKQGNVNNNYYSGYLDSFRVTKGVARYTANFNPETDTYLAY